MRRAGAGNGLPEGGLSRSVASRVLIVAIHGYQAARVGRPSPCRYWPTCSAYAAEAVERHGARRGSWMAVRRVGRCRPWGGHGIDPVPEGAGGLPC